MRRWILLILIAIASITIMIGFRTIPRLTVDRLPIPAFSAAKPTVPTTPRVDRDRLSAILTVLDFPRYEVNDRDRARTYLRDTLTAWGWHVAEQPFPGGVNLVATRPADQGLAQILIAAHYDTVATSPGADDNASAIAVMLELARLTATWPTDTGLTLVFFDQEETGLLGSQAFVAQATQAKNPITAAIVLDMVGYTCQSAGCQRYPDAVPAVLRRGDRGDFLAVIGAWEQPTLRQTLMTAAAIPMETVGIPLSTAPPDLLRSDHASFWQQGIPAVLITDTGNFRNPHYHQPSDQPKTIDLDFLTGVAQTILEAAIQLAGLDQVVRP